MDPARKRRKRSNVWTHFTLHESESKAECQLCQPKRWIMVPRGSTSGLIRHLNACHYSVGYTDPDTEDRSSFNYEESLCKLIVIDGISFNSLAKSQEMHRLFQTAGCETMPTSPNTIRESVLRIYEEKKTEMTKTIQAKLQDGNKFSVSLDEWTSVANKRYLNVNLHGSNGNFMNLGQTRLTGSVRSETALEHLRQKLEDFQVSLDRDVVGVETDGASVMKRLGRLSEKKHQLCIAHGIHLAVTKVLYAGTLLVTEVESEMDINSVNDTEHEDDSNDENPNNEDLNEEAENDDSDNEDFSEPFAVMSGNEPRVLRPSVKNVIQKVRKVVKTFKASCLMNDGLQAHIRRSNGGNELALILDTRTRWNSLLDMLERFSRVKEEVRLALNEFNQFIYFTEDELRLVEEIVAVLKPVKLTVEVICRRDCNLFTCDVALKFMMEKIREVQSRVGDELYDALKTRIVERRTKMSEVLHYLHTRTRNNRNLANIFQGITKPELINAIKSLTELDENETTFSISAEAPSISLESELNKLIEATRQPVRDININGEATLDMQLKKEMALFESGGSRGGLLSNAYEKLCTISPSTVEAERVFSSSSHFCTKVRSRLKDSTLNALVFLKSFYKACE